MLNILQVKVPPKLYKETKAFAVKRDLTVSQILRQALTRYLLAEKKKGE